MRDGQVLDRSKFFLVDIRAVVFMSRNMVRPNIVLSIVTLETIRVRSDLCPMLMESRKGINGFTARAGRSTPHKI
jgi:hypothetical protein